MKNSFVMYRSFVEALNGLDDTTQLTIYRAISNYCLDGIEPILTGFSKTIFTLIKPQLDANNARYENGKKGGTHGKKGGRPKKIKTESKDLIHTDIKKEENPKETPKKPLENPKETPNVNVNVNVNENVNDNYNPPTPLIEIPKTPQNEKKDDDNDFIKKSKERFNISHLEIETQRMQEKTKKEMESYRSEAKRITQFIKEDLNDFIDLTSPAIHREQEFYELLKLGYTAKEIGTVILSLAEKLQEKPIKIKSWVYVKTAVMNYYKDKI